MERYCELHPLTNFIYYICVIGYLCFQSNPIITVLGFMGVCVTNGIYKKQMTGKERGGMLVFFLVLCMINPLFQHSGATVLFYIRREPVTLEALFYGINMSGVIVVSLLWFRQLSKIFHEDQVLYLIGRISNKSALILSMSLKWIPVYQKQAQKIRMMQKQLGMYGEETVWEKCKGEMQVFSAMVTWSLEHSIETADSMKARGYGTRKRTFYTDYCFRLEDLVIILIELAGMCGLIYGLITGVTDMYIYPTIVWKPVSFMLILHVMIFLIMMLLPSGIYKFKENKITI